MKEIIARWLDFFLINHCVFSLTTLFYGNHIRVINYHGTSLKDMDNFEKQLEFFKTRFVNVTLNDLGGFFNSRWRRKNKPGLIITFDDAHRSNFANALPLLNRHGFTGWFMIPCGVVDYHTEDQSKFIGSYLTEDEQQFPDRRFVMNWDEVKEISMNHVLGCHTFSHHRMHYHDAPSVLEKEIIRAKTYLEEQSGHKIQVFCWVGGEEWAYTKRAADTVRQAGYLFSFMTNTAPITRRTLPHQIQRTNIEADYPIYLVRFQLGILMDIFYLLKRMRVNLLTR